MKNILVYYIIAASVIAFIVYGVDKLKAKRHGRRISESALLWLAFAGGSFGAWAGMQIWRHKTMHRKFRRCIPAFMILHALLLFCLNVSAGALEETESLIARISLLVYNHIASL